MTKSVEPAQVGSAERTSPACRVAARAINDMYNAMIIEIRIGVRKAMKEESPIRSDVVRTPAVA
jgi:hypothetical protein